VQILVSDRQLSNKDARIKGLKNVSFYRDGKQYKYTCGSSSSFQEMQKLRRELSKRFKGCFVVAFEGDKRIDLDEARCRAK
jgi:N-acetylmuramoyl-L-alanine amidase